MENKIRVETPIGDGELTRIFFIIILSVLIVWLCFVICMFSWGSFIGFIVMLGLFIAYLLVNKKHPHIIVADSEKLCYTHFRSKTIKLTDIKRLVCEPYSVRTIFDTLQYIKLLIITADDEIELHDSIDANKMLENKLQSKETDIPLIRLYEFLKEKTGLYKDISSE